MATTQTGKSVRFDYTGTVQEYIVPSKGLYKLEVWGASGGNEIRVLDEGKDGSGGLGGYSCKYIYLNTGEKLYICCGGSGSFCPTYHDGMTEKENQIAGGYNGGGCAVKNASGGGATHIASTNRGVLHNYETHKDEVIVVAGGGGGGGRSVTRPPRGGDGGGLTGINNYVDEHGPSRAGTQTDPGKNGNWTDDEDYQGGGYWSDFSFVDGEFGQGTQLLYKFDNWYSDMDDDNHTGGYWHLYLQGWTGGGGGWYGGAGGLNYNGCYGGAGGSGYIGTASLLYEGITYENFTQAGVNNGHGSALITPMQNALPSVYLGTNAISSIYFGTHEITGIKFGAQ